MTSSTSNVLKFAPHPNGDTDVFPGIARTIHLFEGYPDLLHLRSCNISDDQNPQYQLITFKNGTKTAVFDMTSPDVSRGWMFGSDGKTTCVWGESQTAIFITHKNRSFKAEKVAAPKHLHKFMRSKGTNYFVVGSWSTDFKLFSSATDGILLRWRRTDCRAHELLMVGAEFVLCHVFEEKTLVRTHQLQDSVYVVKHDVSIPFRAFESANLGDHYIMLVGSAELAVVDSRNGDVSMWSFAEFVGKIRESAARFAGDSVQVFVSTQKNDSDKTCLIHVAKFRFKENCEADSKDINKVVEILQKQVSDLMITNKDMKRELDDVRTDNEMIHGKLAKLEKKMVKLMVNNKSTVHGLPQVQDSDSIRSSDSTEQEPSIDHEFWPRAVQ